MNKFCVVGAAITALFVIASCGSNNTNGPGEVFWFDFAIGTIAGMTLSVIALIFLLPVFLLPLPAAPSTLFHNGRGDRDVLRS